jgi:hypothetical protein
MKTLLILITVIAIGAGAFFAYPLFNEGTKSSCKALERRALTLSARDGGPESVIIASLARQLLRAGKGKIAAEFSRQRNPDIPVALSCTVNYWHSMMDRDWLTGAISEGLN